MTALRRFHHPAAYDTSRPAPSHWEATAPPGPDCPPLADALRVDAAIIGAGYAGLSAALELARAGRSVAVLEAGAPGWGASGRNGGFCCLGGARLSDAAIARRFGAATAEEFRAFKYAAIDGVAATLDALSIDADPGPTGELLLAHSPKVAAALREDPDATWLDPAALAERGLAAAGMHGGALTPAGFPLHPLKYARGLARAVLAAGAAIHAATPVTALAPAAGGWRLSTPQGEVTAARVLVATNGYSAENLPDWIGGRILPVLSAVLTTRPLTPAEQAAQGWTSQVMASDSRQLLHYFRLLPDGSFLFGARGGRSAAPHLQGAVRTRLLDHFRRLFPAWAGVEIATLWSGLVCLTGSFTPYAAPVPGADGLYAAFGWHGNGVAAASEAGRRIGRLMAGGPDTLPALMRHPPARVPMRRAVLAAGYAAMGVMDGRLPPR